MLRLLADLLTQTAQAYGGSTGDYDTPAERLAEQLAAPVPSRARRQSGEARRAEVTAFLIAAGGEG